MAQIQLKHLKSLKKLSIYNLYSSRQLARLITHLFKLREPIIGVTDQNNQYYDIQYLAQNIKSFQTRTLTLVTYKELSEDNMSFTSSHFATPFPLKHQKQEVQPDRDLPQDFLETNSEYMGNVQSQSFFQNIFLEKDETKVLIKTNLKVDIPNISIPYYIVESETHSATLYIGFDKMCELFFDTFDKLDQKLSSILLKLNKNSKKHKINECKNNKNDIKKSSQVAKTETLKQNADELFLQNYSFDKDNKQAVLKQLENKLDRGDIGQLEYFKLKCLFYEHPEEFQCKFMKSSRQQSVDGFRQQIMKSREERIKYENVLSDFSKPSKESYSKNPQIPIIVRRNNNVIQKISTNYTISPEQQHNIHLLSQLQLKGLISEAEGKLYKSLVIYDNKNVHQMFSQYFNENFDQIQLSKKLKSFKKNSYKQIKPFSHGNPEPLNKLIQKTCSRGNINFLIKLATDFDQKIITAYDSYLLNRDEALFGQTADRIASACYNRHNLIQTHQQRCQYKRGRSSAFKRSTRY